MEHSGCGYADWIDALLRPAERNGHTVLDVFAGCGGILLGFEAAGFRTVGIEADGSCVNTYNHNLQGDCTNQVITADTDFPDADIAVGGPPCQPFSVWGGRQGRDDGRNGFPAFIKAVRTVRPRMWMFENVRGLYKNPYFKSNWEVDVCWLRLESTCVGARI